MRQAPSSDIITAIHDPRFTLGKRFWEDESGAVKKEARVSTSLAIAVQHQVLDVKALEKLLSEVADDPHAAICNSAFPLIPIGQEFLLLSEREFRKHDINRYDESVTWPVEINYRGKVYPALGRFREHITSSSWQILDRDIDEHTPPYFASLSYDEWLAELEKLMPGISGCARLRAHSSSARVSTDGRTVGGGNGHTWVQLANATDVNRLRSVLKARAIALDMVWKKPRRSRESGEVLGSDVASIIDWSVFTPGRLVFVGKPVVDHV